MRRLAGVVLAVWLGVLGGALPAQDLGTPIMGKADPQMVYPNSTGWLDSNGRVAVVIQGENLAYELGHPADPNAGYLHVFVRGVSPGGDRATAWVLAVPENGVQMYGGTNPTGLYLGVDPARFLSEPGSHLQIKLWVSEGPTAAADPAQSTARASRWSAIKTIDVAPAGKSKPAVAPAADPAPVITRIVPGDITLLPGASLRLKVYGQHISTGAQILVVFNGDVAGAVASEDAPHSYEDDKSFLKDGESLIHVTIPEKYRPSKPGSVNVAVRATADSKLSAVKPVTFSNAARVAVGSSKVAKPDYQPIIKTSVGITGQANLPPAITRLSPASVHVGDKTVSHRIRVYLRQGGGAGTKVIFDGDEGGAVAAEDLARAVDDDGTALKDGERVFHVTVPEKYWRTTAGGLSVVVVQGTGRTDPARLDFVPLALRPQIAPIAPAKPAVPAPKH